jgi:hypothetical protein
LLFIGASSSTQRMPVLFPFDDTTGDSPCEKSTTKLVFGTRSTGAFESNPPLTANAAGVSRSSTMYSLPFQYAGVPKKLSSAGFARGFDLPKTQSGKLDAFVHSGGEEVGTGRFGAHAIGAGPPPRLSRFSR